MTQSNLYYTAADVRHALSELGPTGTRAEGVVASAAGLLAELIDGCTPDADGIERRVTIRIRSDAAMALQGGRSLVEVSWEP